MHFYSIDNYTLHILATHLIHTNSTFFVMNCMFLLLTVPENPANTKTPHRTDCLYHVL